MLNSIVHSVKRSSRARAFHSSAALRGRVRPAKFSELVSYGLVPGEKSKDKGNFPIAVRIRQPLGHVSSGTALTRVALYRYYLASARSWLHSEDQKLTIL